MRKNGFTLIEVLVAATIIAVLTAVSIVTYTNITKRSRDTKRKGDLEQIRSALEMYRADTGGYPDTGAALWTNADNLQGELVTSYMGEIPSDPKDPTYVYRYQARSFVGGKYYDYCVSAFLELNYTGVCPPVSTTGTCTTPDTVNCHNYGLKSP